MKLKTDDYTTTSSFQGEQGKGGFNQKKLGFLLDLLVRNYNNPEIAVLREWVSNAHDSHVLAGQTKPVKVTLPTTLKKMLIVQDFGVGMSHEDFVNTYMFLGTSTKDEDNEGIGGFGIGSKSALAIADQYTVRTFKDGLENFYIIKRDSEGGISYQRPIADRETDEPNGVITQTSVDRTDVYTKVNLNNVLGGWSSNDIEITNGNFVSIVDDSIKMNSCYVLKKAFDVDRKGFGITQVMVGPVLYNVQLPRDFENKFRSKDPYSSSYYDYLNRYSGNEAYVIPTIEIGKVTFPSSREVIEMTKSNLEVLQEAYNAAYEDFGEAVRSRVENFNSEDEALKFTGSVACRIFEYENEKITYDGEEVPELETYNLAFLIDSKNRTDFRVMASEGQVRIPYIDRHGMGSARITIVNDEGYSANKIRTLIRHRHKVKPFEGAQFFVKNDEANRWEKAISSEVLKASELEAFRKENPIAKKASETSKEDREEAMKDRIRFDVHNVYNLDSDNGSFYLGNKPSCRDLLDTGCSIIFLDDSNKSIAYFANRIIKQIQEIEEDNWEKVLLVTKSSRHSDKTIKGIMETVELKDYLLSKTDVLADYYNTQNSRRDNYRKNFHDSLIYNLGKVIEYHYEEENADENLVKSYEFLAGNKNSGEKRSFISYSSLTQDINSSHPDISPMVKELKSTLGENFGEFEEEISYDYFNLLKLVEIWRTYDELASRDLKKYLEEQAERFVREVVEKIG